jgi:predicted NBD/HSP70 family sugar kinase
MTARPLLAGLDIGGSKVLAVAVDPRDEAPTRVVEQIRLATRPGPDGVVETAYQAITALAERLGGGPDLFAGVGIGVPGLVDAERGAVTHAVNLGVGTGGLDLADQLRRRLQLPVAVDNDVNAAAIGAAVHLRLGRTDLAYLSIGTGIAAGIVLEGTLRRGPHGAAGEIGHIPVDPAGPECSCGQRGCLEAVASGSAIAARWPGDAASAAHALFSAADAGDARAVEVRDEVARYLAGAVRLLALTVDVDLVVLGGGVAEVGEPLRHAVALALDAQAERSDFLRGLDLAARLSVVPRDRPVAAIGAALLVAGHPAVPGASWLNGSAKVVPS